MTAQPLSTEQIPLRSFAEKAYLNYSMYVILDRALPQLSDGLKPVQRRIIYAMSELGLKASAKFKKSARTIGDVLGKFHPHGDTACYEAMVLMAQPFSYRYPFVDGQGNWGSADDPKSFAAMRYTEARLSRYSELLLKELEQGTVDWQDNFDGTLEEPTFLPARVPNILLNGSAGIAVGMATDIPPHNLREVVNACIHLLDHPKATLADLLAIMPGPDFPTGAHIITAKTELLGIYEQGTGSVRVRAAYHEEDDKIVITALPYQTSGAKVLEQIAALMQAKKLPMLSDLRDESDQENPTRLVLIPRGKKVDSEALMGYLFSKTDLEKSHRVNLNMIGLSGKPQVKDLLSLLTEWLTFRQQTVKKRLEHRLGKILARLHALEGLLIAFLNLDEVIRIVRYEDHPKSALIGTFKISEIQAEIILETKLRQLAKLEEMEIRQEEEALTKERQEIEAILTSPAKLKRLIQSELKQDAKEYGDDRRSLFIEQSAIKVLPMETLLPSEPLTVILSKNGWVRAAKGHDQVDVEQLNYKAGDTFLAAAAGRSNQPAIFLDSTGRAYSLPAHTLPSARTQGEPLTSRLHLPEGAQWISVLMGQETDHYLLASDAGYGFIVKLGELISKNRAGKAVIKLPNNSQMLTPRWVEDVETQFLAAVTNDGRLLLFPVACLPQMASGKGNQIIPIPTTKAVGREEFIVDIALLKENSALMLISGNRQLTLKAKDLAHYHGERARRGHKLPRGFQRVQALQAIPASGEEEK